MVKINPFKGNEDFKLLKKADVTVQGEQAPAQAAEAKPIVETEKAPATATPDNELIKSYFGLKFTGVEFDPMFAEVIDEVMPQYAAGVKRYAAVAPEARIGSHEATLNEKAPQAVNGNDDFTPYLAALDPKYNNVETRMRIALDMEDFAALT